ncbi:MAG: hypothetical protein AAGE98_07830 [Actinomycetota bacterium]
MSLHFTRRTGALITALALLATACGGGDGDDASGEVTLRSAGDVQVDESDLASTTTTTEAVAAAGGAGEAEDVESTTDDAEPAETTTTLPQEELSEGEALFQAIGVFQSCLDADGFEFIGIPGQASTDPDAPVNQQPYIDALIACAARSQIQERLADADAAQQDLSPEEVEEQNRQYLEFRDCMIGRGWDIPDPVPNEVGLLFPGFGAAAAWSGPPGEDIATTDDVGECTAQADIQLGDG